VHRGTAGVPYHSRGSSVRELAASLPWIGGEAPCYRASPNEVTSRSIVDPLRRKDFATVWLSLHSTSLCNRRLPRSHDTVSAAVMCSEQSSMGGRSCCLLEAAFGVVKPFPIPFRAALTCNSKPSTHRRLCEVPGAVPAAPVSPSPALRSTFHGDEPHNVRQLCY
jgi:hypothetical protein